MSNFEKQMREILPSQKSEYNEIFKEDGILHFVNLNNFEYKIDFSTWEGRFFYLLRLIDNFRLKNDTRPKYRKFIKLLLESLLDGRISSYETFLDIVNHVSGVRKRLSKHKRYIETMIKEFQAISLETYEDCDADLTLKEAKEIFIKGRAMILYLAIYPESLVPPTKLGELVLKIVHEIQEKGLTTELRKWASDYICEFLASVEMLYTQTINWKNQSEHTVFLHKDKVNWNYLITTRNSIELIFWFFQNQLEEVQVLEDLCNPYGKDVSREYSTLICDYIFYLLIKEFNVDPEQCELPKGVRDSTLWLWGSLEDSHFLVEYGGEPTVEETDAFLDFVQKHGYLGGI